MSRFPNSLLSKIIPNSLRKASFTTRVGRTLAPLHTSPFSSWLGSTYKQTIHVRNFSVSNQKLLGSKLKNPLIQIKRVVKGRGSNSISIPMILLDSHEIDDSKLALLYFEYTCKSTKLPNRLTVCTKLYIEIALAEHPTMMSFMYHSISLLKRRGKGMRILHIVL